MSTDTPTPTSAPRSAASPAASGFAVVGADVDLVDDPIRPEWVLAGHPRARIHSWAVSPDAIASTHVWDCTAGRFRWYFEADETISIIDGSVTIGADGVEPVRLTVGDAAYFRAGTWTVWDVETYVRKHAVLRVPVPSSMAYVVRGFGARTHRLR